MEEWWCLVESGHLKMYSLKPCIAAVDHRRLRSHVRMYARESNMVQIVVKINRLMEQAGSLYAE